MADQQPQIGDDVTALMTPAASHGRATAKPVATGGGRGTGLDVRKSDAWLKDSAPMLGAGLATMAGPGGLIPATMLAAGGGFAGASLRGDSPEDAAIEAAKQAAMEVGGRAVMAAAKPIARGFMKGAVPKNIGKEFDDVDIAQEMLDRGVMPGIPSSARRVEGLSRIANMERDAAAKTAPSMSAVKAIEGYKDLFQQARAAAKPDRAAAILDEARQTVRDIGPSGLSGEQQLARKDILQQEGKAALNDPRRAAIAPQMANAERRTIVSNLRSSPRMAKALDESQALMAIDQVMQDAAHSNPVTRMRIGGPTAALLTPAGLAGTAHAINQGRQVANPQVLRLLDMLLSQGSHQQ